MTKIRPVLLTGAALLVVVSSRPAGAEELGGVTFHGFASQGYLKSSDNRYLSVRTDEGSFAFTEVGLNFSIEPTNRLRVASQLLARDLGAQGNTQVVLDWGLGDYRIRDWFGVRAGRIKAPIGLYNILTDADVARPEILQPGGFYAAERRDVTNAVDGGGVYGTVNLGGAGYLAYDALFGTLQIDETYLLTRLVREGSATLVRPLTAAGFSQLDYGVGEVTGSAKWTYTAFVEWRPPVAGLRFAFSAGGVDIDFSGLTTFTGFRAGAPVALGVRSTFHRTTETPQSVVSGEYTRGGLRLSAEYSWNKNETAVNLQGLPFAVPDRVIVASPETTYGQVAYRFNEHVQLSGYYAVYYSDADDKDGARFVAQGQPAHAAWSKDLAFTARVDINPHWLFKAEVHDFNGTANLSPVENPDPTQEDWTLVVLKMTFHF
jgi:hypothetical protein